MRSTIADAGSTLDAISWPLLVLLLTIALFIGLVAGVWLEERENARQIQAPRDEPYDQERAP